MAMTLDGTSGITQMTGSIVMSGSTSGTTTIIPSAVAGTTTVTMPAATGTMMVSGNMPTFSAYLNTGSVTITSSTWTKMQLNTEHWDTANCYDNATNYRFTPNVAGYYQVNIGADTGTSTGASQSVVAIYKNGSSFKIGNNLAVVSGSAYGTTVSGLVYLNGTTDYIEAYIYIGATTAKYTSGSGTFFDSALIRGA